VRFARLAGLVADALDLRVGAIAGEYCPGDYSLHAGGVKVGGISQRVTKSASATEGMVVVEGGARIREVLVAVNAALGVDWDPATAGDLGGPSLDEAQDALLARIARDHPLEPAELDAGTLALAGRYATRHDASDGEPPKRLLSAPAA
jgi:octanoyl-[GcvH]:protein N-octanoyltransferase